MPEIFSARNLSLQKYLRFVVALILLAIPATVAAQATLEWELVNPFRFIRDQKSNDDLRNAYNSLEEKTPSGLERRLQEMDDEIVAAERAKGNKRFYAGWFSRLAENNYEKTCWDAQTLTFRDEGDCKDYVHPTSHKVRVWVSNFDLGEVEWYLDGVKISDFTRCRYTFRNCIEFSLPYDRKLKEVSVKVPGFDGNFNIRSILIQVKDKLVVGLGDSYGSGEGNPDIPAHFDDGRSDIDIIFKRLKGRDDTFLRREPKRDKDSEVSWLDRRCHRSMYSYQFKTALQMALANPKEAVTFVSYSCSGAVTENLINVRQAAREKLKKKILKDEYNKVRPQLDVLKEVLKCPAGRTFGCTARNSREIDYLLLSIGGNDIGFADYVTYIITSGLIRKLKGKKPTAQTKIDIERAITENYGKLSAELNGLDIKGCTPGAPCERILLTAYPDIMHSETETLCKADREEFSIPFGRDEKRADRIREVRDLVFDTLRNEQEKVLNWSVVTGHFAKYLQHGFCAQGDTADVAERFWMPIRNKGIWGSFEPKVYKAYESRLRWIRLPVDSKMTTDQVIELGRLRLRLFYIDATSNVMHPTAQGLAATADANFQAISNIK
jgi:hypothetical protein